MMKYALIVNNVVTQIQPNNDAGFVQVPDNVVVGMVDSGGGVYVNPTPSLADAKIAQKEIIKKSYLAAIAAGYTCPTSQITMDMYDSSLIELKAAYDMEVLAAAASMPVRDYNNVTHTVLIADALTLCNEAYAHAKTLKQQKWTREDSIDAAGTVAAVKAIVW